MSHIYIYTGAWYILWNWSYGQGLHGMNLFMSNDNFFFKGLLLMPLLLTTSFICSWWSFFAISSLINLRKIGLHWRFRERRIYLPPFFFNFCMCLGFLLQCLSAIVIFSKNFDVIFVYLKSVSSAVNSFNLPCWSVTSSTCCINPQSNTKLSRELHTLAWNIFL